MTRAPFSTAHLIALASASIGIERERVTTFATRSCAEGARPAIPMPLSTPAAISPATNVPWPNESVRAEPPTKLFASRILPGELGVSGVDARVDHGDRDRLEGRERDPRLVEAAVGQVPLLRDQRDRSASSRRRAWRAARRTGSRVCRRATSLSGARATSAGMGASDSGLETPSCARWLTRHRARIGVPLEPYGNSPGLGAIGKRERGRAHGQRERRRTRARDEADPGQPATWSTGDFASPNPVVAEIRARYAPGTSASSTRNAAAASTAPSRDCGPRGPLPSLDDDARARKLRPHGAREDVGLRRLGEL